MKIYLHEITDQDTQLDFGQDDAWLVEAVARVDEKASEADFSVKAFKNRPAEAHINLRKVDNVVVVSGEIDTQVQLICSRCAAYYKFHTHPEFSSLYCKDPVMAGVAYMENGKTGGQNKGFARHAHDESNDQQDLDITYISEDFIDLSSLVTEQIQLQVPFQPLCKSDCKGICAQCGADLNQGRCACAKIIKETPFSVLKDLKV